MEFHQELIRIQLPPLQQVTDVVVLDDEQIADRAEGPTEARVHPTQAAIVRLSCCTYLKQQQTDAGTRVKQSGQHPRLDMRQQQFQYGKR